MPLDILDPVTANQTQHDCDKSDHQQNVDQATDTVNKEAENPADNQDNSNKVKEIVHRMSC